MTVPPGAGPQPEAARVAGPPGSGPGRDLGVVLCALVWAWVVVPRTIQTLTAPKYRTGITDEAIPYTTATASTLTVLGLAVLGLSVFLLVDGIRRNEHRPVLPLLVLLLPWICLEVRDITTGAPLRWSTLLYPAVVTALWVVRPGRRSVETLGYLVSLVALVSVVIGVLLPSQGTLRTATGLVITENKTLLPWGILVGIFTHGNNLGQFLVLAMPVVAVIRRRWYRTLALAVLGFGLVWSAARAAIATGAVVAVVIGLLALVPVVWRPGLVRVALVVAFGLVCALPLLTTDATAFSNRGGIWGAGLLAWRVEPLFGWGSHFYADVAQTSQNIGGTVFHNHNEFVQLLVTGGLVLTLAVAVMLGVAVARAARLSGQGNLFAPAYLLALAGASLLEPSLVLVDNFFLFPVVVLPLGIIMLGDLAPDRGQDPPPEPVHSDQEPGWRSARSPA